jgi:hypothetical protein
MLKNLFKSFKIGTKNLAHQYNQTLTVTALDFFQHGIGPWGVTDKQTTGCTKYIAIGFTFAQ